MMDHIIAIAVTALMKASTFGEKRLLIPPTRIFPISLKSKRWAIIYIAIELTPKTIKNSAHFLYPLTSMIQ